MELDRKVCDRARRSRDPRFDGRFFIAATSTGIYCRPICPARSPKDANVRYYPTAAAAQAAGFRPCLRCRPEAAPGTPAWMGTSSVVSRGLRLISEGALDDDSVEKLADRLGVTDRHLRRLFVEHLGATPLEVAITRRVHFAKKLLDETTLSCAAIAQASGFGSLRRFNGDIKRMFSRTPTELRRLSRPSGRALSEVEGQDPDCYRFRLSFRPPYDWEAVIGFLSARATPGVEAVSGDTYRRTMTIPSTSPRASASHGTLSVTPSKTGRALELDVHSPEPRALLAIVERVRRIFDLGADPLVIADQLRPDPVLRLPLSRHMGIRVPGAWDAFEIAVRAVIGQQVSVRGATTLAGRVASMFGTPIAPAGGLTMLFPTPKQLRAASIERAGIIPARAEAIRTLARLVDEGTISFNVIGDTDAVVRQLRGIGGIGDWTAQYIAMKRSVNPTPSRPAISSSEKC